MDRVIKLFATGFGVGYLPKAPGTFGTVVGVLLFFAVSGLPLVHYIFFTVVFSLFSVWVADRARVFFAADDPAQIVIDEAAGFFVTMIGQALSWKMIIAGFILFRIFDIAKPFPIRWFDRNVHGGFGIVLDDLLAGIYANIVLSCFRVFVFS